MATLWVVDRIQGAPITGELAPAKTMSEAWRNHPWAAYNPAFWLCWAASSVFKTLGRWSLRLLSCNLAQLDPLRDESPREFELRTFWVLPMSGWFAIALLVSLGQAVVFLASRANVAPAGAGELGREARHPLLGAGSRAALSAAFLWGNALLLSATRRRDLPLLQACTTGFVAFAGSFALLTAASVAYDARHGLFAEAEIVFEMCFSVAGMLLYGWQSAVCYLLCAEYAARRARAADDAKGGGDDDAREAERRPARATAVLGAAAVVAVLVVALSLTSLRSDPEGFFSVIG